MAVVFNGVTRQVEVTDVVDTSLDVELDIYSAWKDWSQLSDNSKYAPAMRSFGGDPTVPGQAAPKYFFLQNFWVVFINNGNIVNVGLNLYTEDYISPYIVAPGSGVSDRNSDAAIVNEELVVDIDAKVTELHKLQGLDSANPMTVTPTQRSVDDIDLTISGDGETVTVVTRQ